MPLTSLFKLLVEEGCHTLLLYLEDHVEAVDGEDEVDGEGEEENHKERLEDWQRGGAGHLHLQNKMKKIGTNDNLLGNIYSYIKGEG